MRDARRTPPAHARACVGTTPPAVVTAIAAFAVLVGGSLDARTIGSNRGAASLTATRVQALPAATRARWAAYLDRSWQQSKADRAALADEVIPGRPIPAAPAPSPGHRLNLPLDRPAAWYAGTDAQKIADTVLSFQTPAGGWSKNQDRSGPPRLPGQRFANDAENMNPDRRDFDAPDDRHWTFVGTLDNGATISEIRFLGRVAAAVPSERAQPYHTAITRGISYLLAAQYPNGGWPQIWPLEGGFHDAITFNDDALAEAATLLDDVAAGRGDFAFAPSELRDAARAAVSRAVRLVLDAQIRVGGRSSCWSQQVDPLTLAPTSARNYEPRSIATAESAGLMLFLMDHAGDGADVRSAVRSCAAWLQAHSVRDLAFRMTPTGRRSVAQPGATTWARNYDIATGRPIFGDRDKTIHDTVNDLSRERRDNYAWYGDRPLAALARFARWPGAFERR